MVLGTSGLRFTKSGAVERPQVLQIRVTQRLSRRLSAGAPVPRRGLSRDECEKNLRYFSEGLRGPRSLPCTSLVISGADWHGSAFDSDTIRCARSLGFTQITMHASMDTLHAVSTSDLNGHVDAFGVASHGPVCPDAIGKIHSLISPDGGVPHISVVKSLNDQSLATLEEDVSVLIDAGVNRIVLTWPLVSQDPPPHAQHALSFIAGAVALCDEAGVPVGLKGFPLCVLGKYSNRAWRSKNRYYVDAEHQGEDALLFFPDVIQLQKLDRCRQCIVSHQCDGVPPRWLELGITGPIEPME